MNKNTRKGSVFGIIALVIAAVAAIGGGGYAAYKYLVTEPHIATNRIDAVEVANAERNLERLFSSAQQTFIHRNQKRMAWSIEELGNGFSIGSNGTIIHMDIWYARYGRPESDIPSRDKQEDWERDALKRPYRYAVLPVRNLESDVLDARTSVCVALPVAETDIPVLVMIAGPVRSDPQDFLKKWTVYRVEDSTGIHLLRELIDVKGAYDKTFADKIVPFLEEPL